MTRNATVVAARIKRRQGTAEQDAWTKKTMQFSYLNDKAFENPVYQQ
jgi:hypothetical protein